MRPSGCVPGIWKGAKSLSDALDQLLSYLTSARRLSKYQVDLLYNLALSRLQDFSRFPAP